jgi:hypothetical protein
MVIMDEQARKLAQFLEAVESGEETAAGYFAQHPQDKAEISDLLDVIDKIQRFPTPAPEKRFRYKARSRILTALIDQKPVTFEERIRHIWHTTKSFYTRRPAMSIVLIVALVLSLFGGGTAYASQGSIPGELLYSLKLNIEEFRLGLTSEEGKADLYLQFANERVEEVKALIDQGSYDEIGTAMRGFESKAEAIRQAMSESDGDPLAVHIEVLTGLLDKVPYQAQEAIKHAIEASSLRGEYGKPAELPGNEPPAKLPVDLPPVVPDGVPPVLPVEPPVDVPGSPPIELPVADPQVPVAPELPVDPPVDNSPVEPPVTPPAGRP